MTGLSLVASAWDRSQLPWSAQSEPRTLASLICNAIPPGDEAAVHLFHMLLELELLMTMEVNGETVCLAD